MSQRPHNCMDHKPDLGIQVGLKQASFTCPVCGKRWQLAQEWPGQYWEEAGGQDSSGTASTE